MAHVHAARVVFSPFLSSPLLFACRPLFPFPADSPAPLQCGDVQKGEEWRVFTTVGDIGMDEEKGTGGAPARGQEREATAQSQRVEGLEALEAEVRMMSTSTFFCVGILIRET